MKENHRLSLNPNIKSNSHKYSRSHIAFRISAQCVRLKKPCNVAKITAKPIGIHWTEGRASAMKPGFFVLFFVALRTRAHKHFDEMRCILSHYAPIQERKISLGKRNRRTVNTQVMRGTTEKNICLCLDIFRKTKSDQITSFLISLDTFAAWFNS